MLSISISIDCRMIGHSGIGTYLQNVIRHLVRESDLKLICLGDPQKIESFEWSGAVRIIPLTAPIFSIREHLELPFKIPDCDIFWSPQYNIPILPIRAKKRVVTIHDVYHMAFFHTLSPIEKIYAKLMLNAAVRRSDAVITVSVFSKSEILRYLGANERKIHVIYNGGKMFPPPAPSLQTATPYILFVGNVKPHKNLKNAIAAFSRINVEFPELLFLIVGEKDNLRSADTDLTDTIEAAGPRVLFTGHVDDIALASYYQNAAMLLFSSYYEGFGLPILEAMQFGIPIAASNAASIPEVGGDFILYFNPFDVNTITNAIRQILSGNYHVDGEKYKERLSLFSWELSAKEHLNVFRNLIQ